MNSMLERQIRAAYNDKTIRVYQAYNNEIADTTLQKGKFVSPPFKIDRMTWIKTSFLWMMYRCGWGFKDNNQKRILAIDINHEGFEWALTNACLSHFDHRFYTSEQEWQQLKAKVPVVVQWDPEKDIYLNKLNYRSIQIGLSPIAVKLYINDWIEKIEDITSLCHTIHGKIETDLNLAISLLPEEKIYTPSNISQLNIGLT